MKNKKRKKRKRIKSIIVRITASSNIKNIGFNKVIIKT